MGIPNLIESAETMRCHWDHATYPHLVYVETTNACNGRCTYCLYDRMERPVECMPFDIFCRIADKVNTRGLKIGATFCFGEPLYDRNLFDKIRYARRVGVATKYLGLNSNASLLTPGIYDDLLDTCSNITLSFVHVEKQFEQLTRNLSWQQCYENAVRFIEYRDKHKPEFTIEIGINDVPGHDRDAVKKAFSGYKVAWARDAAIDWSGKAIIGVIDRSIMYHNWMCDGYKGAMQIKPNGDCCFCAYDVIRSETRFANIITDDWATIERNFKTLWQRPSSLCLRCDFWWNYHQMVNGGWCRGAHIDDAWQSAYNGDGTAVWDRRHETQDIRYLTDSAAKQVLEYLQLDRVLKQPRTVLNVGVGTGRCSRELVSQNHRVYGLDIATKALERCNDILCDSYTHAGELPDDLFDIAICHLVVQHMADVDVIDMFRNVLRSVKPDGVLAVQYASPTKPQIYREDLHAQLEGLVQRTPQHFARLVELAGGMIIGECASMQFDTDTGTEHNEWNGAHIRRERLVRRIGM